MTFVIVIFNLPAFADQFAMTKPELLKAYYQECLNSNTSFALAKYNDAQCACTASGMSVFMNEAELEKYFNTKSRTNFERGRVMYLGYIPCLEITVQDVVYDTCRAGAAACRCAAINTGRYAYEGGDFLIPGFTRNSYVTAQAPPNPLEYLFTDPRFILESGNIIVGCTR
ncbi:MAG: hypothetical protein ACT4OY_07240 [Alphaproteobacteria bacterium]